MINIGIDLSMNSCGIVVINEYSENRRSIIYSTTHHFIKRNMDLQTQLECKAIIDIIMEQIRQKPTHSVGLYIELGNYGNAAMTQKFGVLAGMIMSCLTEKIAKSRYHLDDAKLISPNEWFKRFVKEKKIEKPYNQLTREQRKQLSMQHSGIKQDDISDAYWIAVYGGKCKGMYE